MPNKGHKPNNKVNKPRDDWWTRVVSYIKRKAQERSSRKKEEEPAEKAARRTANATIWIAFFTLASIISGGVTVLVLRSQLNVMQNDERAWIQVKEVKSEENNTDIISGSSLQVPIYIANVGKTPAKNISAKTFVNVLSADIPVQLGCVDKKPDCLGNTMTTGIYFPNERNPLAAHVYKTGGQEWIPAESDAQNWRDGKTYTATFGLVTYWDVFGEQRWTKFCFFNASVKALGVNAKSCTDYNDAY